MGAAVSVNLAATAVAVGLTLRPDLTLLEQRIGPAGLDDVAGLAWVLTGAVLAWLRPRNALGWLFIGLGTCGTLSGALGLYAAFGLMVADPWWPLARWAAWLSSALWLPALVSWANLVVMLYPNGRLPGRRWRWPAGAAVFGVVLLTTAALLDPTFDDDIVPGITSVASAPGAAKVLFIASAILLVPATVAIWVMSIVRLVRSRPPERQQLAWLLLIVVPMFSTGLVPGIPEWFWQTELYLIPAAVGVGVFRYNLLGIEVVLRRGLVYGVLTAAVVAAYLLVSVMAGTQLGDQPLVALVAAALVAVVLLPLRDRLQRAVDLLVYGERRDPLQALARLADQVAADEPDLLSSVLRVITVAVRAPGAAVVAPGGRQLAAYGSPASGSTFPLLVGGVGVGTLNVAMRSPGEAYTRGDQRLLAALVPQVAVVVRALDLAESLELERDRVVAATRVERARLQQDLHDGLGPSLAGIRLGLLALEDAAAAGDRGTAADLLSRIRLEVDTTVGEVRRIIDGLRPAVLDDTGLADALRRHAEAISSRVRVDVDVAALPPLPPQVETAAYRIAQEAVTNVIRHSDAHRARVSVVAADGMLSVQVADDGEGIDQNAADGVGLASMRQRAEALGGSFTLASRPTGTTVTALIPFQDRAQLQEQPG